MKTLFAFTTAAMFSTACLAGGDDLVNCVWHSGERMSNKVCSQLRAEEENEKQATEHQQESLRQQRQFQTDVERQRDAEKARLDQEAKVRQAEMARTEEANKRYREELAGQEAQDTAAKKAKCGKDFMALRVGMSMQRFEECNEALSYVTDKVAKDGPVDVYRSTFHYIQVQDGRIVGYTRRTF